MQVSCGDYDFSRTLGPSETWEYWRRPSGTADPLERIPLKLVPESVQTQLSLISNPALGSNARPEPFRHPEDDMA